MLGLERFRKERGEMTKRYMLVVLVILAVAGGQAHAGDRGFYVGGGVGVPILEVSDFDEEFDDLKFENRSLGFKIFGGYQFNKYFAAEGTYSDYSNVKHHEIVPVSQENLLYEINVAIDAWDLSVLGRLPVGEKMAFYLRLGGASWSADVRTTIEEVTENESRSGADITYGGGFDYQAEHFGMRVELDWLDMEDTSGVFMPTLSLTYSF
jgi:hypothetical protein